VVAIGVSSGGPRIVHEILSGLPPEFGLAVLVVQHMAEGFMPGLITWLQPRCPLPIKVAEEGDAILPGRVLFAPDFAHLVVTSAERVHLSSVDPVNGLRPSVDVAFASIAGVYGARAAGIVLTGMGADGAAGLFAIRDAGGLTMVQDEASCVVFGMPRAAIERGAAQRVLTPAGLIEALNTLHRERHRWGSR
jgi:two-component system chemotaxis response regulator CheB